MAEAIASFTGMPKKTSRGMRMLAPPSPVREPTKPTGIEIKRSESMFMDKIPSIQYSNPLSIKADFLLRQTK